MRFPLPPNRLPLWTRILVVGLTLVLAGLLLWRFFFWGWLKVESELPVFEVYVNRNPSAVGSSTIALRPGRHFVEVVTEGRAPYQEEVQISLWRTAIVKPLLPSLFWGGIVSKDSLLEPVLSPGGEFAYYFNPQKRQFESFRLARSASPNFNMNISPLTKPLALTGEIKRVRWSPGRNWALILDGSGWVSVRLPDGKLSRLPSKVVDAAFKNEGEIVYLFGGQPPQLTRARPDGTDWKEIVALPQETTFLSLSGDGRFALVGPIPSIINLQTAATSLLSGIDRIKAAVLSQNGELVAAVSPSEELVLLKGDGGEMKGLGRVWSGNPFFTSDGRLLFARQDDGRTGLFAAALDGEERLYLAPVGPAMLHGFAERGEDILFWADWTLLGIGGP